MIDSNPVHEVCDYGAQALYRELPTIEQIRAGVIPLDSLPAAWWNALWNDTNKAVNEARNAIGVMVNELCNVLVGAGICPSCSCLDQLYQSINKIRQTLATASIPGSVVSSDTCGEVSVNSTTGIMTANGLGNAANLATSARTAVGAINELKQTYDCCINDINTCTGTLNTGKAPVSHASSATTYGVGNATDYGHVRLSDTFASCVGGVAEGVAASQKALYDMYTCITSAGYVTLGNTAGCALGTASAGSANTAARSDHVHPLPSCVQDKYGSSKLGIGWACASLTCAQIHSLAAYSKTYESNCTVIKDVEKATVQSWLGLGTAAYCAAGCFRASTWTPSVVDCSKRLAACDDTVVCLVAERGNEINMKIGTCTNAYGWLNYRGGVCAVKVGLGTGNGCLGDVCARCFYGCLCGTAARADKDSSGCSFGTAARCAASAFRSCTWYPVALLDYRNQNLGVCVTFQSPYPTNNTDVDYIAVSLSKCETGNKRLIGFMKKTDICVGHAARADKDSSGCSFGTAARCAASAFRSCTWYPYDICAFGSASATRDNTRGNWTVTVNTGSKSCDVWKAICWATFSEAFLCMHIIGYVNPRTACTIALCSLHRSTASEYVGTTNINSCAQHYCCTSTATVIRAAMMGLYI